MKLLLCFLVGLLSFSRNTFTQPQPTKRALIIAIGAYKPETGWQTISSQNDVSLIRKVLEKQGFADIAVLSDIQADRKGIEKALHDLIGRSHKGDKIVIHISSHGQQISDQDNDEPDGFDEAIVCYGAPYQATGRFVNYDGSLHLRDEDLGRLIDSLRTQLGSDGDVLLLADACHSGTITRGSTAKIRGGGRSMVLQKNGTAKPKTSKRQKPPVLLYQSNPSQTGVAPYVAISAANASESNSECWLKDGKTPVGSLSLAFNQAMQHPKPGESYRDLFARIQSVMKQNVPGQTPQVEGDIDRQLFGGSIVSQEAYLTISEINADGRQLQLPVGQLNGIFDSTKVAVCPIGTRDAKTGPVLAKGVVISSGPYSCLVQLDKPVSPQNTADYWVFVTERSSGDMTVNITLDSLTDASLRQLSRTELEKNKLVGFTDRPDLYLKAIPGNPAKFQFRRADGTALDNPIAQTQLQLLSEQVQRYAQSQFLQQFSYTDNPSVQISMRLVPLREGGKTSKDTIKPADVAPYQKGTLLNFSPTDTAALLIKNQGTVRVYINIIDIMPTGELGVVLPTPADRQNTTDYYIEPGETKLLNVIAKDFAPPFGKETFKIFATTSPVDLRQMINRSQTRGGPADAFTGLKKLFNDTNNGLVRAGIGTRGVSMTTIDATNIATFNYEFFIVDKRVPITQNLPVK